MLRSDMTSYYRFAVNYFGLFMWVSAYNLLHKLQQFYLRDEEVKRSFELLIKRLIKGGAKVSYQVGGGMFMRPSVLSRNYMEVLLNLAACNYKCTVSDISTGKSC